MNKPILDLYNPHSVQGLLNPIPNHCYPLDYLDYPIEKLLSILWETYDFQFMGLDKNRNPTVVEIFSKPEAGPKYDYTLDYIVKRYLDPNKGNNNFCVRTNVGG